METKFTPGKWSLSTIPFELRSTDSAACIYKDTKHGNEIGSAVIADISRSVGDTEATANAKLIAAAPDLFEALEKAVNDYGKPGGPWNVPSEPGTWIEMARAALTKATH